MEIRHLKSFKTIVELEGFGRAAESLSYAQSTITSHIQAIEKELGSPVFERLGKKIILTETGKQFLPYATEMLELYTLSTKISNSSDTPSGSFIIGSTESLTVYRLIPVINEFKELYPGVNISLKAGDGDQLRDYLRSGEIDVALLVELESKDHEDLQVETLSNEPMVLVEPPEQTIDENKPKNTILYTQRGCSYRAVFERFLSENDIPINTTLEFRSVESIKQSIMHGLGISMLPLFSVFNEIQSGRLKAQTWDEKNTNVPILLAYHKNKWISPALKVFIEIIKKRLLLNSTPK